MPQITAGARSDVGAVRVLNEDTYFCGNSIWFVADGMGGHAAGDVASAMAREAVCQLDALPAISQDDLVGTIVGASDQIYAYGMKQQEARGLGTTIAGLATISVGDIPHWAVFNVGDSRVYRFDGSELSRATVDHSEVEELILAGSISETEAKDHPSRSIITRSLGSAISPEVDLWILPFTPGEIFLICTDGLTGEVPDSRIAQILQSMGSDPLAAAELLVSEAVAAGGRDNVTVAVVSLVMLANRIDEATRPRAEREQQKES